MNDHGRVGTFSPFAPVFQGVLTDSDLETMERLQIGVGPRPSRFCCFLLPYSISIGSIAVGSPTFSHSFAGPLMHPIFHGIVVIQGIGNLRVWWT